MKPVHSEREIYNQASRPFILGAVIVVSAVVGYLAGYYSRPVPTGEELIRNHPPAVQAYADKLKEIRDGM